MIDISFGNASNAINTVRDTKRGHHGNAVELEDRTDKSPLSFMHKEKCSSPREVGRVLCE